MTGWSETGITNWAFVITTSFLGEESQTCSFFRDLIVLGSSLENDGWFRFLMAPLVVDKVAQAEMFIPSWPRERALLKEEAGCVGLQFAATWIVSEWAVTTVFRTAKTNELIEDEEGGTEKNEQMWGLTSSYTTFIQCCKRGSGMFQWNASHGPTLEETKVLNRTLPCSSACAHGRKPLLVPGGTF